ncbi:MAG: hypothetical protein JNL57_09370 [Bacteroidetes bacterium]|nr:hypothetical protein [Bacteroidota bacterium]
MSTEQIPADWETMELKPDGIFTPDCTVFLNEVNVGHITRRIFSLRLRAEIQVHGNTYNVRRDGFFTPVYIMENEMGEKVADAARISFWGNKYQVNIAGRLLQLKFHVFSMKRVYDLIENEQIIGRVGLKKIFSRTLQFHCQKGIPAEARLFILWLILGFLDQANSDSSNANNM